MKCGTSHKKNCEGNVGNGLRGAYVGSRTCQLLYVRIIVFRRWPMGKGLLGNTSSACWTLNLGLLIVIRSRQPVGWFFFCYTCDCVHINCLTHANILNIPRITQNIYFLNTLKKNESTQRKCLGME